MRLIISQREPGSYKHATKFNQEVSGYINVTECLSSEPLPDATTVYIARGRMTGLCADEGRIHIFLPARAQFEVKIAPAESKPAVAESAEPIAQSA